MKPLAWASPGALEAAIRLAYLADGAALNAGERAAFGQNLWAATDTGSPALPVNTDLLPHEVALLPGPDCLDVLAAVRARLYEPGAPKELISAITGAALHPDHPLRPDRQQALRLFAALTTWRAATNFGTPSRQLCPKVSRACIEGSWAKHWLLRSYPLLRQRIERRRTPRFAEAYRRRQC